jgi:hypothetical protein
VRYRLVSARETALEFIARFTEGDVEGLAELLADDVHLSGPLLEVDSRADYLRALREDPPERAGFRVLDVTEDGDRVSVSWEYQKPEGSLVIDQWFEVTDARIQRSRLTF